ncbi:hypothetical protein P3T21_006803 [Paraburkholderia sp. GAS334]
MKFLFCARRLDRFSAIGSGQRVTAPHVQRGQHVVKFNNGKSDQRAPLTANGRHVFANTQKRSTAHACSIKNTSIPNRIQMNGTLVRRRAHAVR